MRVLAIHSSGRQANSSSRQIVSFMADQCAQVGATVETLDLVASPPTAITSHWIDAGNQSAEQWSSETSAARDESDRYIAQLKSVDLLLIGAPMYNFTIPGTLKLWIDQVGRGRSILREPLGSTNGTAQGRRAVVVVSSGGVAIDAENDFATPYLRHFLNYIGIDQIDIVQADMQMKDDRGFGPALDSAAQVISRVLLGAMP